MRANQAISVEVAKKTYVKPQLLLHGSVQKLTEKVVPIGPDIGSNIRIPILPQRPGNQGFGW